MTAKCARCSRPLKVYESVIRGLGPICVAIVEAEMTEFTADRVDLPFDAQNMDILCRRDEITGVLHFNIYQTFRHHSPTGMEWGYGGSGPADFALNILALFIQGDRSVSIWDGQKVPRLVWALHQPFKWKFIASMDRNGGAIIGDEIKEWIKNERKSKNAPPRRAFTPRFPREQGDNAM